MHTAAISILNKIVYKKLKLNLSGVVSDLKLISSTFSFKSSQIEGYLGYSTCRELVSMLIRLISQLRAPLGVVKVSVDGCSKYNPDLPVAASVLCDHQDVRWDFAYFLRHICQKVTFATNFMAI